MTPVASKLSPSLKTSPSSQIPLPFLLQINLLKKIKPLCRKDNRDGRVSTERLRASLLRGASRAVWAPHQRCCRWAQLPEPSVQTDTCCPGGAGAVSISLAPGPRPEDCLHKAQPPGGAEGGSDLWGGTGRDTCVGSALLAARGAWGLGSLPFIVGLFSPLPRAHTWGLRHPCPPLPSLAETRRRVLSAR